MIFSSCLSRRDFLKGIGSLGSIILTGKPQLMSPLNKESNQLDIACNSYTWQVFYRRENRNFYQELDVGLAEVAASGINGFEPGITSVDEIDHLEPLLKKHHLEMRSIYVNSTLHEVDKADTSISTVISIAKRAFDLKTRIIVTNPSPIKWGGPENKTDDQLKIQADALNLLGTNLKEIGMTLAYHNHDIEFRNGAREFHHMMLGTDPELVKLCLDAHWIYRGSGNSNVALFDIVKLYGTRTVELHLRQSKNFIWTETFGKGDVNYLRLIEYLRQKKIKPHLVLEQAVEKGSDNMFSPFEAHQVSIKNVRRIFKDF
jgi:inosose dehydratase